MALWQRKAKNTEETQAGYAGGLDPKQPRVFSGQTRIPREKIDELMQKVAAPLGDSTANEIVDHSSGKYFQVTDISAPGGTDVPRP